MVDAFVGERIEPADDVFHAPVALTAIPVIVDVVDDLVKKVVRSVGGRRPVLSEVIDAPDVLKVELAVVLIVTVRSSVEVEWTLAVDDRVLVHGT